MVMKLPSEKIKLPNIPTDRVENFFDKLLENRPAQLDTPYMDPTITVTTLVSPPACFINSEKSNPNDGTQFRPI